MAELGLQGDSEWGVFTRPWVGSIIESNGKKLPTKTEIKQEYEEKKVFSTDDQSISIYLPDKKYVWLRKQCFSYQYPWGIENLNEQIHRTYRIK